VVLVEALAAKPGGLTIEAPLVERDAAGVYSAELARILGLRSLTEALEGGRG
jgi:hypothetical protein